MPPKPPVPRVSEAACDRISFGVPMCPPSVNHYVKHFRNGRHAKTKEALTWEQEFALVVREELGGRFVIAKQFAVTLDICLGPKMRLDVDNGCKCALDAIAVNGLMRNIKGERLSDSHVKKLTVMIHDSKAQRKTCQQWTRILIEALP